MYRASLRFALLATALSAVAFSLPAVAQAAPERTLTSVRDASAIEAPLLSKINATRRARGLAALRRSPALARAAALHARSMGRRGFFSHSSRDGTSPGTRIRRYYGGKTVGEVMLWRSPDITPTQALRMWLQSPPHRRLLLSSGFREIGLAAVHAPRGVGAYGGRPVTIVVADLGSR